MNDFHSLLLYILIFCMAASIGSFLVWRAKRLFLFVKPELLRKNIITFFIGLCFLFAFGHLIPDFRNIMEHFGWGGGFALCCVIILADVVLPYNIVLYITEGRRFSQVSFARQQVLIFLGIVFPTIVSNGLLNIWVNESTRYLKYSVVWSFYMAGFGSLIYLFTRQYDQERKKKLVAKELEVVRLSEAKTRAELDALHSRINPHFLYNALNSIADLSVTDGHKARAMTISLADLFRRSINYSGSIFTTVKEEIATVTLYLDIEKIRFEDQLQYSIIVAEEAENVLLPKFLLQPIVENAVKHGLKKTHRLTQVKLDIRCEQDELLIKVEDNGPAFPAELVPGYGLKAVYDQLELLFPGRFEIKMINEPQKYLQVMIKTAVK